MLLLQILPNSKQNIYSNNECQVMKFQINLLKKVVQRYLSCGCEVSELVVWVCNQQLIWSLVPFFSEQVERGAPFAYLVICDTYFVGGVIGLVLTILETALLGEYKRNTGFQRRTRRYNLMISRIRHHEELTSGAAQSGGSLSSK